MKSRLYSHYTIVSRKKAAEHYADKAKGHIKPYYSYLYCKWMAEWTHGIGDNKSAVIWHIRACKFKRILRSPEAMRMTEFQVDDTAAKWLEEKGLRNEK